MDGFVAGYRDVFTPVLKPSSGGRPSRRLSFSRAGTIAALQGAHGARRPPASSPPPLPFFTPSAFPCSGFALCCARSETQQFEQEVTCIPRKDQTKGSPLDYLVERL
jgi:hypothetical protein